MNKIDSFQTLRQLEITGCSYDYYSLPILEQSGFNKLSQLPYSLKVLLENLLRHEDGQIVKREDIHALLAWLKTRTSKHEIAYYPARVLMQDFTGVPAIVDLSAMRDAFKKMGGDPKQINPLLPIDLVIDHSLQVDTFNMPDAFRINAQREMERNHERYTFLRWGQKAFTHFQVVPPNTGICHQVNLEFLAKTIWHDHKHGRQIAYPDTLIGTDSHTTMVNGLSVLGWGVGGIEAEAAMLGQPLSMLIPEVIGVKLTGQLREGVTATDLVLTLTQRLRQKGVVGQFVEYFGTGLAHLPVTDRATIANMAPEYGATCGFFPIDPVTLDYLRLTGRDSHTIALVETYAKAQGMWYEPNSTDPLFTDRIELDLSEIEPSLAGPKRPQDRVTLSALKSSCARLLADTKRITEKNISFKTDDNTLLHHGDVVIAAITSCTNTSNPNVMLAAGLVAKKALEKGLQRRPWVKTSLAPGSPVVTHYLQASGLQQALDQLGFSLVGYGCTTCIGHSGPLSDAITQTITQHDVMVSAVLSGNRNFEGRIHPQVKMNWLASPPLVVVFALTGTVAIDLTHEPIGHDQQGQPIYLKDIWPSNTEIAHEVTKINHSMFRAQYANIFAGNHEWQSIPTLYGDTYPWQQDSTYIQYPPFFQETSAQAKPIHPIKGARILALLGDSITTDHISPAGSIKPDSPAGHYLLAKGIAVKDFNSYGARRGNHEIMMRGTFANIRLQNEMVPHQEGGITLHHPSQEVMSIYDAAMRYQSEQTPLLIIAGKEYGTGSSRDWAAKGPKLLGVRAVLAESFERIHRSNLIGMGILPLQFKSDITRKTLNLNGTEIISLMLHDRMQPNINVELIIQRMDGTTVTITLLSRIDTQNEMKYYCHDGILPYMLRSKLNQNKAIHNI